VKSALIPIIKREYLTRLMSKGFWISTALFPLLTIVLTVLPSKLAMREKISTEPVAVVDLVGGYFPLLQAAASEQKENAPLQLEDSAGKTIPELKKSLNDRAERGEIQGYLIVDEESLEKSAVTFYARNPTGALSSGWLPQSIADSVRKYRLQKLGISDPRVDTAVKRVEFEVEKATNDPKKKQSGMTAVYMSIAMVLFIYFALIFYGVYVLRGVLEEKSNRIVEIVVSAVRPFDLMMGKILGIGAVGLTQVAIWLTFALLITAPQIAGFLSIAPESRLTVSGSMLAYFPVFFVLGYFLYATIYAGIGSMFNSEEDAQQMVSSASMLLVIPMLVLTPVMKNPNGALATVLSLIPFFSPILMYLRIAVQAPPLWQVLLSIAIMIGTIFAMVWIVAKIYRVGILMYGKKPTIPEVMRWLKYT
jgi:ABC-2 type transport system permease protein